MCPPVFYDKIIKIVGILLSSSYIRFMNDVEGENIWLMGFGG